MQWLQKPGGTDTFSVWKEAYTREEQPKLSESLPSGSGMFTEQTEEGSLSLGPFWCFGFICEVPGMILIQEDFISL